MQKLQPDTDLVLQQVLPYGERPFADVLLADMQASHVCHLDWPPLAG